MALLQFCFRVVDVSAIISWHIDFRKANKLTSYPQSGTPPWTTLMASKHEGQGNLVG